jgi:hypothetical protein
MHQPAVTVGGDDAKPLFHPLPPSLDGGHSLPPVVITLARARAGVKTIRTNPLIVLDSAPEMQRIAAKSAAPTGIPSEQGIFFNLAGNPPAAAKQSSAAFPAASNIESFRFLGHGAATRQNVSSRYVPVKTFAAEIYASAR